MERVGGVDPEACANPKRPRGEDSAGTDVCGSEGRLAGHASRNGMPPRSVRMLRMVRGFHWASRWMAKGIMMSGPAGLASRILAWVSRSSARVKRPNSPSPGLKSAQPWASSALGS